MLQLALQAYSFLSTGKFQEGPPSAGDIGALGTVLALGLWQRVLQEEDPYCVLHAFCAAVRASHNITKADHPYFSDPTDHSQMTAHITWFLRYLYIQWVFIPGDLP